METLQGKNLINIYGQEFPAKSIINIKKYILFYFSASWSKPCEVLLPKIKKVYEENCKRKLGLEIIYVSFDNDPDEMLSYYKEKHGNWYAVPFGDDAITILRWQFSVTHIPYLVAVKTDGTVISPNARKDIEELGINVLVTWTN